MQAAKADSATPVLHKGDTVTRGKAVATVTYASETHDYAEMRYGDGFAFRSTRSGWKILSRNA